MDRLVDGVWWKTTQENYAQLGLIKPGSSQADLQPLSRVIANIARVLEKTGAIDRDPTGGQPASLYYDGILAALAKDDFHPAAIRPASGDDTEAPRPTAEAGPLDDKAWERLSPVGTLEVANLVFARGTARLTRNSERTLNRLIETLDTWPHYYLAVSYTHLTLPTKA